MAPRQLFRGEACRPRVLRVRRRTLRLQHALGRRQGHAQVRAEGHQGPQAKAGRSFGRRARLEEDKARRGGVEEAKQEDVLLPRLAPEVSEQGRASGSVGGQRTSSGHRSRAKSGPVGRHHDLWSSGSVQGVQDRTACVFVSFYFLILLKLQQLSSTMDVYVICCFLTSVYG